MDILKKLFHRNVPHSTFPQNVQDDNRNRRVLAVCREVGFPEPDIRRALVTLNKINMRKLANGVGVTTLYNVLKEESSHPEARGRLAEALGLRSEELFQ
jgi:hypothetical protein